MQSFTLDERDNPYKIVAPRKQPRVALTPTLAFKNNKPFLCFSVQGRGSSGSKPLQVFLKMVEFNIVCLLAAPMGLRFRCALSSIHHAAREERLNGGDFCDRAAASGNDHFFPLVNTVQPITEMTAQL